MIHYLIGTILADQAHIRDRARFLLGSVLPDAFRDVRERDVTHFVNHDDLAVRFYDFEAFRQEYSEKMQDSLYLGYYMHLVEDNFYRRLIRVDHEWKVYEDPKGVEKLHRDYEILNSYIVGKWQLQNEPFAVPEVLQESLLRITDFDIPGIISELEHDFTDDIHGTTVFLTEEILEEFLDRYLSDIKKEFRAVLLGERYLSAKSFAWRRG